MADVAERAAHARELGTGEDEFVAAELTRIGDAKYSVDRVRLFIKRIFDAPIPASLAAAEAYSACLVHRDGIGDLALTKERVDVLSRCVDHAAQGGAVSCGYAEAAARGTKSRPLASIPTTQELERTLELIKNSLVVVEKSESYWLGVVATGGEYAMIVAQGLKIGDEVVIYPVASPEQRQTSRVVGATPKYDIAVIAPAPVKVQPVRMLDQEALIHGQPLVALYWEPDQLYGELVAVGYRARAMRGGCFPAYVEVIGEDPFGTDGPVFDQEARLVGFGDFYYKPEHDIPLYVTFTTPAKTFLQIADRVHRYGYWRYGRIGIVMQDINQELVDALGLSVREGVLVNNVEAQGPARRAGLLRGDVIIGINGKRVAKSCDVVVLLKNSSPDDLLRLDVQRRSARLTINVRTVEGKDAPDGTKK
jgi:hypothetical protein